MRIVRAFLLLAGLSSLAACAGAPPNPATPMADAPPPMERSAAQAPAGDPAPVLSSPRFTVHFDYDSAEIRASAMQILHGAAQVAKLGRPAAIRLYGYTDTRGRKDYNRKLSARRAAAVADQFRKLGVPVEIIEIEARGEADPLVPAKGEARENRRVEIVLEGVRQQQDATLPPPPPQPASAVAVVQSALPVAGVASALPALRTTASSVALHPAGKTAIKRDRVRPAPAEFPSDRADADGWPSGLRHRS